MEENKVRRSRVFTADGETDTVLAQIVYDSLVAGSFEDFKKSVRHGDWRTAPYTGNFKNFEARFVGQDFTVTNYYRMRMQLDRKEEGAFGEWERVDKDNAAACGLPLDKYKRGVRAGRDYGIIDLQENRTPMFARVKKEAYFDDLMEKAGVTYTSNKTVSTEDEVSKVVYRTVSDNQDEVKKFIKNMKARLIALLETVDLEENKDVGLRDFAVYCSSVAEAVKNFAMISYYTGKNKKEVLETFAEIEEFTVNCPKMLRETLFAETVFPEVVTLALKRDLRKKDYPDPRTDGEGYMEKLGGYYGGMDGGSKNNSWVRWEGLPYLSRFYATSSVKLPRRIGKNDPLSGFASQDGEEDVTMVIAKKAAEAYNEDE